MRITANLKGDFLGGVTTSVISLPLAIAFGVLAFAPLGEGYVAQGALTGLYGVIVAGILTSLFGGTPGQIAVPTAPMSVMVTSIIANLLKDPEIAALGDQRITVILVLVSMTILFAGVLQLVLGAIGGGKGDLLIRQPRIRRCHHQLRIGKEDIGRFQRRTDRGGDEQGAEHEGEERVHRAHSTLTTCPCLNSQRHHFNPKMGALREF